MINLIYFICKYFLKAVQLIRFYQWLNDNIFYIIQISMLILIILAGIYIKTKKRQYRKINIVIKIRIKFIL